VGARVAGPRARAAAVTLDASENGSGVRVEAAGPGDGPALVDLFDRAGVACFCRYWHFPETSNAWLARMAHAADTNRYEFLTALREGSEEALGVVARKGDEAIGWLKLAPATSVPKMYERRPYRNLPCLSGSRDGVFVVGCMLVDPRERHRSIPDALVAGAIGVARERGGRAIEALPRRAADLRDEERWMGSFSTFSRAGFRVVHDFGPYPVLRLSL